MIALSRRALFSLLALKFDPNETSKSLEVRPKRSDKAIALLKEAVDPANAGHFATVKLDLFYGEAWNKIRKPTDSYMPAVPKICEVYGLNLETMVDFKRRHHILGAQQNYKEGKAELGKEAGDDITISSAAKWIKAHFEKAGLTVEDGAREIGADVAVIATMQRVDDERRSRAAASGRLLNW